MSFLVAGPQEIRFSDVLNAVDYDVESATCVFGWGSCDVDHPCPLHPFWSDLKENCEDWAHRCTLASVERASRENPGVVLPTFRL